MRSVLVCNRWVTLWALTSDPKKTPPCTACWSTACTSISPSESTFCLHQLLTTLLGITTFCLHQLLTTLLDITTFCLHQLLTTLLGITTFCLHQLLTTLLDITTFCLHQLLTTLLGITTFCLHQLLLNITTREQTNPVSHARMCWNAPCDHWRLWWFGLGNLLCCCWLACRMWVCSNQCSVFLPAVELSITVFTQGIICIMTSESN